MASDSGENTCAVADTESGDLIWDQCRFKSSQFDVRGVCRYSGCVTVDSKMCSFPFR